ncbi:putative sugar phosphate/phosphate translocator [Metarhizium anisopliae]
MLFVAWVAGTANPTLTTILNILWVVGSVILASTGEIQLSLVGFLYQMGGIVAESIRLIMIQLLLSSDGLKMDPLVGLYYLAPACCLMNFLIALSTNEVADISWHAVKDIGQTSGLVMTLAGILKNILLIIVSFMIWHTQITVLQAVGYTSALAGLIYYSLGYNQLPRWKGTLVYNAGFMRLKTRRVILAALIIMTGLVVLSPRLWNSYKQDERTMQAVKE